MLWSPCCVRYEQDDHADRPQVPAIVRLGRFCGTWYLVHGGAAKRAQIRPTTAKLVRRHDRTHPPMTGPMRSPQRRCPG
jgi:hypothetical protein